MGGRGGIIGSRVRVVSGIHVRGLPVLAGGAAWNGNVGDRGSGALVQLMYVDGDVYELVTGR